MLSFFYDSEYIKSKQEEDYHFFGNIRHPIPTWKYVMDCFELSLKEDIKQKENDQHKPCIRELENYGFVIQKLFFDDYLNNFKDSIEYSHSNHRKNNQVFSAHIFTSFSSISKTFGLHTDTMDVWCWQIVGETQFTVLGKRDKFEKILTPGELIYVPRGMEHDTKPLGPRALISFCLEDLKC